MRTTSICLALLAFASVPALAQARLSPADEAAAFRAAGFRHVGRQWKSCTDGSDTASYTPGSLDTVRDIDGDGLIDAVIVEGSAICYGMTGQSFWLVSKQAGGGWRLITSGIGIPTFLPRRGARGWPDIEIGGPGFCFPVQRWNRRGYATYRFQYEGKPCRR
jgi:hypothetical protein